MNYRYWIITFAVALWVMCFLIGQRAFGQTYDDGPPPMVPGYIAQIQKQIAGVSAMQARLQSDVTDLKEDLRRVNDKLDAVIAAKGGTFTPSTLDEWGRGAPASFKSKSVQTSEVRYGYSSGGMQRARLTPLRSFWARLLGGGRQQGGNAYAPSGRN